MDLIQRPPWSNSRMLEYFSATAKDALTHGLTAVHDAGLSILPIELLQRLSTYLYYSFHSDVLFDPG